MIKWLKLKWSQSSLAAMWYQNWLLGDSLASIATVGLNTKSSWQEVINEMPKPTRPQVFLQTIANKCDNSWHATTVPHPVTRNVLFELWSLSTIDCLCLQGSQVGCLNSSKNKPIIYFNVLDYNSFTINISGSTR